MRIHTELASGRIDVMADFAGDDPAKLAILPDPGDVRFRQWFAFGIDERDPEDPRTLSVSLENASSCTWARGWKGYQACCSSDGVEWKRVKTTYDGTALGIELPPGEDPLQVAYYPPYPMERLESLLERAEEAGARRRVLAVTDGGLPVHAVTMGVDDARAPQIWIVAQQHPGEHMAGWFAEGFIEKLLGSGAPILEQARINIVPRVNPDGAARGHHRTSGTGLDMNRQWAAPPDNCPEIAAVRAAMMETGVDFFLDVHGDETIPYVFMQGTNAVPRRTTRVARLESQFGKAMTEASPDFQTKYGYPREKGRMANLGLAANWVGNTFRAVAFTLEMPFTDNANAPDPTYGWSTTRCVKLAEATVDALRTVAPKLRG